MDKQIKVPDGLNKTMIAFLKENMNFSGRKTKRLLKDGLVLLNNKKAYGDSKIKDGDIICFLKQKAKSDYIFPQKMPLSILFEDEYLLIIDKAPFISMLPSKVYGCSLANGIRYYFDQNNIKEPVRFYNRLDMNTSGIVMIPKDGQTHSLLERYSSKTIIKKYQVVVSGIPRVKNGIINKPISVDADERGERYITNKGKDAITKYTLIEAFPNSSLLDIQIETGRTHQIRIHMNSIGHSVIGDILYGVKTQLIKRQALHAYRLVFLHPIKKQSLTIESPLPEDMKELISALKKKHILSFDEIRDKSKGY
ncbi:MAG: RluA family pseudouridine synthase [Firmicutes bacterium]|nr:RluA family pseudouridine synthase [Bacillota bacterium]